MMTSCGVKVTTHVCVEVVRETGSIRSNLFLKFIKNYKEDCFQRRKKESIQIEAERRKVVCLVLQVIQPFCRNTSIHRHNSTKPSLFSRESTTSNGCRVLKDGSPRTNGRQNEINGHGFAKPAMGSKWSLKFIGRLVVVDTEGVVFATTAPTAPTKGIDVGSKTARHGTRLLLCRDANTTTTGE